IIKAIGMINELSPITINTDCNPLLSIITNKLETMERTGWKDCQNSELIRTLVATLRNHKACIFIGDTPKNLKKGLRKMAKRALKNPNIEEIHINEMEHLKSQGIHLLSATQAILHEGIRTYRKLESRRDTTMRLDITRHSVEELNADGKYPTDKDIWYSIRSTALTKSTRGFLWKNMHNAYRIGDKWTSIPNFEHRAKCSLCGIEETMEHILLECTLSNVIPIIWKLTENLWKYQKSKHHWPRIRFGTILGCALSSFKREPREDETKKQPQEAINRLFTILVSESAYLIWKIRCERLMKREDDPTQRHTEREIQNKWLLALNNRLKTDIIQTNTNKFGSYAIPEDIVLRTWSGVLQDKEILPDNWIRQAGGLVGIEVHRP
ncbi:hypothetical protein HYPSUDRAFT_131111, partial [Hypholoma sublateritium FD-334 SS-4]